MAGICMDFCVNEVVKLKELITENKFKDDIVKHIQEITNSGKHDYTDEANRWLAWARSNRHLKVISADIPSDILPKGCEGRLHDVRVFTKHGPDDGIYDNNKDIRDRVARGNTFLELTNPCSRTLCVLQAMKKFTGGLGDDDDRETGDDNVWKRYFTKDLDETDVVIATAKANGEAAHLSCVELEGQFVMCGGSKNVHLMFRNRADIRKHVEPRYRIATEVCDSVMDFLETLTDETKTRLLSFLVVSRYTAVFEILSPLHQHVVNLSHLSHPALKFITWTKCELQPSEKLEHLNIIPPHIGISIAQCLGLDAVTYDVISMSDLDLHMKQIRCGYDLEGEVLYFIDKMGSVIGLLKKKTVWYIMLRAIREKIKTAATRSTSKPEAFSISHSLNQVENRMKAIQRWLNLDDKTTDTWKTLGCKCLRWTLHELDNGTISLDEVRDMFPVYWSRFLEDTGSTDRFSDIDQPLSASGS